MVKCQTVPEQKSHSLVCGDGPWRCATNVDLSLSEYCHVSTGYVQYTVHTSYFSH
jgi:hypothetical protein